jgi:hypothetical protein
VIAAPSILSCDLAIRVDTRRKITAKGIAEADQRPIHQSLADLFDLWHRRGPTPDIVRDHQGTISMIIPVGG